jgi:hypothetical protein
MSNHITFLNAEVSSLKVATAKNGNRYLSGFIVDHNAEGGYTTSKAFRTFDVHLIDSLPAELVEFAAKTPAEQKAAKTAGGRPRLSVSGWLQNKADAKGIWTETLIVTSYSN